MFVMVLSPVQFAENAEIVLHAFGNVCRAVGIAHRTIYGAHNSSAKMNYRA